MYTVQSTAQYKIVRYCTAVASSDGFNIKKNCSNPPMVILQKDLVLKSLHATIQTIQRLHGHGVTFLLSLSVLLFLRVY